MFTYRIVTMKNTISKDYILCFLFIIAIKEIAHAEGLLSITEAARNVTKSLQPDNSDRHLNTICTPASIEEFPRPLMDAETRKHGGIVLHFFVAYLCFAGLSIVCEDYFIGSLEVISNKINFSPNVAGATLMAVGSSLPELVTSIIGVFVAKSDIGISGILGSAVINLTIALSFYAMVAPTALHLNWWSICRDCFFYAISIAIMLYTMYNQEINWVKATTMLIVYILYCIFLCYDPIFENWIRSKVGHANNKCTYISVMATDNGKTEYKDEFQYTQLSSDEKSEIPRKGLYTVSKECSSNFYVKILYVPKKINQCLIAAIKFACRVTMRDCKEENYRKWYLITFLVSLLWITFYTYIMVWMITIIGSTLSIPDTVMGLTFIAAGVSFPDVLSGISAIKLGEGNMALSNSIGSNIFDILIGLGLPWFIKTAIISPGFQVKINSSSLIYTTSILMATIVLLIVTTHLNNWKLNKRYGFILFIWYFIFIIIACLYELNVFGEFNPPSCKSDY